MSSDEYRPTKVPAHSIGEEIEQLRTQVVSLLVTNETLTLENFKLRQELYGRQNLGADL